MSTSTQRVLLAEDLDVGYRSRAVLKHFSVDLGPGESLALIGTNGSGKSTLVKTVVGLLQPLGGRIEVLGSPPGTTPDRLAYLGQYHTSGHVLPLRARDMVSMGRFADLGLLKRFTKADRELVEQGMERMGVADLADRTLRDLSGGQQQRMYLAQVLARQADLLVLDEPTTGIDAAGRGFFDAAIAQELDRGASVVITTHDISEASRATQVALLAGRVVAIGDPASVLKRENLLDAFGAGARDIGSGFILTEEPHAHGHAHTHAHPDPPDPAIGG